MKGSFLLLAISLLSGLADAQAQVAVHQPRILILPYTASGQNALEEYESSFAYRTAVTQRIKALGGQP